MAESAPSNPSAALSPSTSTNNSNGIANGASAASTQAGKNTQPAGTGKFWLDPEEYAIRKRLPPQLPKRNCDVYVTNKTAFKSQLDRCKRLIDQGDSTEIYLHSLGAAIPRALNLALQIQKAYGDIVALDTHTSTVELTGTAWSLSFM